MARDPWLPAAALVPMASGCAEVAVWGNVFSMLLTLAIFLGTLSLSREGGPRREPMEPQE